MNNLASKLICTVAHVQSNTNKKRTEKITIDAKVEITSGTFSLGEYARIMHNKPYH